MKMVLTKLSEIEKNNFKELIEKELLETLDNIGSKFGIYGWKDEDLDILLPVFNNHAETLISRMDSMTASYEEWVKS